MTWRALGPILPLPAEVRRILVVSRYQHLRGLLCRVFAGKGFRVTERDSYEAADWDSAYMHVDLIVLDTSSPQVVEQFKRNPWTRHIPLLVLAADLGAIVATDPVVSVLPKPFHAADLLWFAQNLLHPKTSARPAAAL